MFRHKKVEKWIRIITVAPVLALLMLIVLQIFRPEAYGGNIGFTMSVIFLIGLPVSAYPLQAVLPGLRDKGREGQRNLAIWMAMIGYALGIVYALAFNIAKELLLIYIVYSLSGLFLFIFNKALKIRASGHACGVVGPIVILAYLIDWRTLVSLVILVAVYWASIKMKRHTLPELLIGSVLPIIALVMALFCFAEY